MNRYSSLSFQASDTAQQLRTHSSKPCTLQPQEPPNFREMYGFIGNLFDESCRGVDHAAALAGMSASTRSEAGRCLQRLLVNMQVWTF